MKRMNNLYDKMISYSNILYVFNRIKGKCHNKGKVMEFMRYKNCFLMDILVRLKNNSYIFSKYHIFLIREKKYRIIMSESIGDKIVNQLVSYFILLPSFNCLIDENIATRSGRGSSYGYKLFERYINCIGVNKEIYVLRIDINKYFYNINHGILFSMLEKRIKDRKALNILWDIISLTDRKYVNDDINRLIKREIDRINTLNISDGYKERLIEELKGIPLYKKGYGLSIGCLTNQLLACFFLNDLDYYIKEDLGCKYYIRYMDDLYILSDNKGYLRDCYGGIINYLSKIELVANKKSGIYRLKEGVSFLGYTYMLNNKRLFIRYDNNTIKKIRRKISFLYDHDFNLYYKSIASYKGYFAKCNTSLFFDKYKDLCFDSNYDKYVLVKKRYKKDIVFIRDRNRYYTYDDDLLYINGLFKKNYSFFRRYRLASVRSDYVVLHGNEIIEKKSGKTEKGLGFF